MQIRGFKSILERKIDKQGCEDYGSHDWSLIASRDKAFQSNLLLPFFLSLLIVPCTFLGCLTKVENCCLCPFTRLNVRICNPHNTHHTAHIENFKQHIAYLQLVAFSFSHLISSCSIFRLTNKCSNLHYLIYIFP